MRFASDHPVRQIDVDSHWGGLGTPQAFHLTIPADKGDVDPMRVQALVEALAAPRMAHPTCDNLELTADWLRANAQRLLSEHDAKFSDEASKLQKLQIDTRSDVGSSASFYLGSSTVSTPMTTRVSVSSSPMAPQSLPNRTPKTHTCCLDGHSRREGLQRPDRACRRRAVGECRQRRVSPPSFQTIWPLAQLVAIALGPIRVPFGRCR